MRYLPLLVYPLMTTAILFSHQAQGGSDIAHCIENCNDQYRKCIKSEKREKLIPQQIKLPKNVKTFIGNVCLNVKNRKYCYFFLYIKEQEM